MHRPHTLEPPANGSVCRVVVFPPDSSWKGKVGAAEVRRYFESMGSPHASTYSSAAPHPYMQKTRTLDFCFVIEGEITLVLDKEEVALGAGGHRRSARNESRLEQPLRSALRRRLLFARRDLLIGLLVRDRRVASAVEE